MELRKQRNILRLQLNLGAAQVERGFGCGMPEVRIATAWYCHIVYPYGNHCQYFYCRWTHQSSFACCGMEDYITP